jgi:shikimate kinase
LALVGYRGTGKTTVGRLLAARLGRPFVDADEAFERAVGRTISQVFESDGEAEFRAREQEILCSLTVDKTAVLATGGGCVLLSENRRRLREFGVVVWLAGEPAELAERLGHDQATHTARPALTSLGTLEEVMTVMHARNTLYREVADVVIDTTGKDPETVADEVLAALNGIHPGDPE